MPRRPVIASGSLKGYLLEEVVASLIRNAGYRLLTAPEQDPHDLALKSNGLQVRGRGGFHQADVLGELLWAPAFGNPIRLFIEAKWRGEGREKVGIPEARHAVGILQDVNQVLVTVGPQAAPDAGDEDAEMRGRGYCYSYRYALCSTAGFSAAAQAYALAHQVALLDLSHQEYDALRGTIDAVGDRLYYEIGGHTRRGPIVRRIRAALRSLLWEEHLAASGEEFWSTLRPLVEETRNIGELFVGVSATGFVILLKADNPERMIRHMQAPEDPQTSINFEIDEDGSSRWTMTVTSDEHDPCRLSFVLPDAMLNALNEKAERSFRAAALNLKEQHFSRITVYRVTDAKSMICSLKLNRDWLADARVRLENRSRRRP